MLVARSETSAMVARSIDGSSSRLTRHRERERGGREGKMLSTPSRLCRGRHFLFMYVYEGPHCIDSALGTGCRRTLRELIDFPRMSMTPEIAFLGPVLASPRLVLRGLTRHLGSGKNSRKNRGVSREHSHFALYAPAARFPPILPVYYCRDRELSGFLESQQCRYAGSLDFGQDVRGYLRSPGAW